MDIPGFEQVEKVAESGFASYWQAYQRSLDRHATLIVMRPDSVADPAARQAFLRDIRAVAALKHPALFQVYDVMELDASLVISVEHLAGLTLRHYVRQRGVVRPEKALTIARWVAEGLGHVYEKTGLTHLALTPDQVWINPDGQVKILGFGFSDILQRIGYAVQDIPFLSPEQVQHRPCDPRSDAYALGSILYFMLSGRAPFEGNSPEQTLNQIVVGQLPAPLAPGGGGTSALNQLLYRLLMKDPDQRHPGWLPVMQDMDKVLDGAKFLTGMRKGGLSTLILAPPAPRKAVAPAGAPADPEKASPASIITTLLVLGVVVGFWIWVALMLWRMPPPVEVTAPRPAVAPGTPGYATDPTEREEDQRPSARIRVIRQPGRAAASGADVATEEMAPEPAASAERAPAAAPRPVTAIKEATPFEKLTDQVVRSIAAGAYPEALKAVEEADRAAERPGTAAELEELRAVVARCADPESLVYTVLRRQTGKPVTLTQDGVAKDVVIVRIDGRNVMIVEARDPGKAAGKTYLTVDPARLAPADQLRLLALETDPEFAVARILVHLKAGQRDKALGVTPDAGVLAKPFQRFLTGNTRP